MSSTSSKKNRPPELAADGERLILLGKLVGTHGVRGELRLHPFNPESTTLGQVRTVFVGDDPPRPAVLRQARPHGRVWLVQLDLAPTMEAAEALLGLSVSVRECELPALGETEYYHYQLIGLTVVDDAGEPLGPVTEVMTTGANDVLVIETATGERLVPLVDEVVRGVDLLAGRIVVRVGAGMVEG